MWREWERGEKVLVFMESAILHTKNTIFFFFFVFNQESNMTYAWMMMVTPPAVIVPAHLARILKIQVVTPIRCRYLSFLLWFLGISFHFLLLYLLFFSISLPFLCICIIIILPALGWHRPAYRAFCWRSQLCHSFFFFLHFVLLHVCVGVFGMGKRPSPGTWYAYDGESWCSEFLV